MQLTILAASGGTGARAVTEAQPQRIVWLGAIGTGRSAQAGGVAADAIVLRAGGTVFHAGPERNGPLSPGRRTVGLDAYPRRIFPAGVSRATVAAAMLDEAETPRYQGAIAIPLERGPSAQKTTDRVLKQRVTGAHEFSTPGQTWVASQHRLRVPEGVVRSWPGLDGPSAVTGQPGSRPCGRPAPPSGPRGPRTRWRRPSTRSTSSPTRSARTSRAPPEPPDRNHPGGLIASIG